MSSPTVRQRRRGTTAIEFAFACPVVFFVLFAIIVGGLGVFRYQEVAALAREGARWASVHGSQYADETGQPAATAADVFTNAILPSAVGLQAEHLSYQVTWNASNAPYSIQEDGSAVGNTVTVTVTYQWYPEVFQIGAVTLSSTSTVQMMY
jgi:Flp pilus assembly protein TadG